MAGREFSRSLRTISGILVFLHVWVFAGGYSTAWAVKNSDQLSAISDKRSAAGAQQGQTGITPPGPLPAGRQVPLPQGEGKKGAAEKFGKDMEEIEHILADTVTDTDTKKRKLLSKKAEIDADVIEIRKQFKETEEKIKSLPGEIWKRHQDFVKKYDNNLKELRTNLDDIDKAKTDKEKELAHKKAKDFVEKVKAPKKHQKLDPNKLPHRTEEPIWKEPRTKPEEFTEGKQLKAQGITNKPLLVASNGPLTGLISQRTATSISSDLPSGSYQIALANPPTSADLAETIEVQFTPEIRAKAQELGNNPVKIYNWVRNNIEYVPTYGSIQGANMCLQTKLCNDFDTASLLISLLRVSGIHARYVYGTIELPIEKVKNWVGGFTDSMAALNLMATGGIPIGGITEGGQIVTVRKEHIYVEAFIDYFPSRGAKHKNGQGDTWIPLDGSFKQYAYTQGVDIKSAVPFDAQTFIDQIQSTATINEQAGYVTNVNSLYVQQAMQDYQTRVQNYITQNYPNATVGDVIGRKEIIKQEFQYLLGTLPYKRIVTGTKYSTLPSNLRHKASFNLTADNLTYEMQLTMSLPELAGKKITLSYAPATVSDDAVIDAYLPRPHADGTPVQPSELPSSLPAYLINLKPELRVDGIAVATGSPITMGYDAFFNITISAPTTATNSISNKVTAGEYNAIALDIARITPEQMTALKTKLEATKAKLETQNFSGLTKDDILGDLLYTTVLSYFAELDAMDYLSAKTMHVISSRLPSVGRFFNALNINYSFGVPFTASAGGLSMDIGLIRKLAMTPDGEKDRKLKFMMSTGVNSSALEHDVPEQLFSSTSNAVYGISAVKALQIANKQGVPIYMINQSNIDIIIPQLQLNDAVLSDIRNSVSAGKIVITARSNISFNEWTGCGYMVVDPINGSGAFMIAGGMAGGWSGCLAGGSSCTIINSIYSILKSPITQATASFVAGLIGKFPGMGVAIGLYISLLILAFNVTDVFLNANGTFNQKLCMLLSTVICQIISTGLGLITNDAASGTALLLMDFAFVSLMNYVVQNLACMKLVE